MSKDIKKYIRKFINFSREKFSPKNKEFPYYLLIVLAFIFFVIGTNVFIELTEELPGKALKNYDQAITEYIISFRTPWLTSFFQFVTDMGDVYAYIILITLITGFFLVKYKSWKFILQLLGVLLLSALSNIALKRAINRTRPEIEHLVVVESLSYPSGHAMSAMAFYGFLIYLFFRIRMSKWVRLLLSLLSFLMILSIGISRIYLGVHFPSDVAGGFIAGLLWVAFCIVLFNIIDLLRRRKNRHPAEENKGLGH